jgi:predicted RNA-binding Zn ribbon-like protein
LQLVPVKKDWNWVMAEIVASFGQVLARDEADRLKICQNPDCMEVFYDTSKNHTQRWCDHSTCGTLMKVRRFRANQHAKAETPNISSN